MLRPSSIDPEEKKAIAIRSQPVSMVPMAGVKGCEVAGKFYPADGRSLADEIGKFRAAIPHDYGCTTRAAIVPHASHIFSGKLAMAALQYLDRGAENVFVFAPAHRVAFAGLAVCDYDAFATPLGALPTNAAIGAELVENFGCRVFNGAFAGEHAIEVQLPFLRTYLPDARIVPIIAGDADGGAIGKIIGKFWGDRGNVFIVSSDLSHFHGAEEATAMDLETCRLVEDGIGEGFTADRACGAIPCRGLLEFAAGKNFSLVRVGRHHSGEVTGDGTNVVGYGAWILVESEKNKFLVDNFSDYVAVVCRDSIGAALGGNFSFFPAAVPEVFNQFGACFVTLEIGGVLRGCIGSTHAHRPLIADLVANARAAAFGDSRFPPLTGGEFSKISIEVSLLSHPRRITFDGERELLAALTPSVDGLIIGDGMHRAVYLPCVWEQLPDRGDFLGSLKVKAGLPRTHFSKTFEAFKFSCERIPPRG
jgi:AmmeMemoRadiSam system protein B/AmmeMemoRadiSam system protein A